MSGGHYEYVHYRIRETAQAIRRDIDARSVDRPSQWPGDDSIEEAFPQDILDIMARVAAPGHFSAHYCHRPHTDWPNGMSKRMDRQPSAMGYRPPVRTPRLTACRQIVLRYTPYSLESFFTPSPTV